MGLGLESILPTTLYCAAIAAFLVSVFGRRPEVGLYYLIPLLPLQNLRYRLHEFPLGAQLIDFLLLGVVIGSFRKYGEFSGKVSFRGLIIFLGIFTYLSLWRGAFYLDMDPPLWISDPRFSDWKNYMVMPFIFLAVIAAVRDRKQMKILLVLMCLAVLMINRSYISTARNRDYSTFSYSVRDAGVMGYTGVNGLAAFEAQIAVFLLALYSLHLVRKWRWGYLGVMSTSMLALMYTLSRGGYAAALVGIAFVSTLVNRKILLLLLVFLVIWQGLVPTAVTERIFMTKNEEGGLESSANDRVALWDEAMAIFKENAIFGTGFYTYKYEDHGSSGYRDTHNYFVKVLLETGVIGLIIYLTLLWKLFAVGFRLYRTPHADGFQRGLGLGLAGWILAAAVANFFGDRWTYIEIGGYMWTLTAFVVRNQMDLDAAPAEGPEGALSEQQELIPNEPSGQYSIA